MSKYLPDTNILIRALHGLSPEDKFLRQALDKNEVVLSVIAVAEFYVRAYQIEEKVFDKFVKELTVIKIDEDTAKIAAKYRKDSLKTTRTHLLDCFIAAQARQHNLTIVTNNTTDFPMKDITVMKPKR